MSARDLYDLLSGSLATCGEVTLAASPATTTTVIHYGVSSSSVVSLSSMTSAAASALASTYIVPATGQFVINHVAAAGTRTFRYHFHTPRKAL